MLYTSSKIILLMLEAKVNIFIHHAPYSLWFNYSKANHYFGFLSSLFVKARYPEVRIGFVLELRRL